MGVTVSLAVTGTDEEPRWAALVKYHPRPLRGPDGRFCCSGGHWTPEAAAAHALETAMAALVAGVRALKPPDAGALALERLERAAG